MFFHIISVIPRQRLRHELHLARTGGEPSMSSQTGSRMTSYAETIAGLKKELEIYVRNLKSSPDWPEVERLYCALVTIEELAGAPKTTLEQLFDLKPASAAEAPQNTEIKSSLAPDDQVETEVATEIEKGS